MHCFLCGSLLYARMDQVGSTIPCHDCHSPNEVRPPRPQDIRSNAPGPSLDDAEEFVLSATFERPTFSPIERPPVVDDNATQDSFTPLIVTPTQAAAPAPSKPMAPAANAAAPSFNSPSTTPPQAPRPPIRFHDDTYGDELWNGAVETGRPAFERSPFLIGIAEFLFHPGTLPRWLALVALAAVPIAFISGGSGVGLTFGVLLGIPWLVVFGAHAMAIVQDTGRGKDAVEQWPQGGFVPPGNPLFLPVSAAVAMLPGLLFFVLLYVGWESPSVRAPMMMLVSAMLFIPLFWLPMLLEKSLHGPLHSPAFWQSFRFSGDGWITFYCETLMLSLVAAMGVALWEQSFVIAPLSAALLVTPLLLYFRLVGRLLWYIDPAMAPPPPARNKPPPPPLPETVDPMIMK